MSLENPENQAKVVSSPSQYLYISIITYFINSPCDNQSDCVILFEHSVCLLHIRHLAFVYL